MKFDLFVGLFMFGVVDGTQKASERLLREEFMRKMDSAIGRQKSHIEMVSKLIEMASPLEDQTRRLDQAEAYDINMTNFALRYIGCQNIHTFSDDLAEDGSTGSVLGMDRFVVVRLCPKDACSNYHKMGCNYGYGDYLIPMEDYLETMSYYYFADYQDYCETCYMCMHQKSDDDADANDDANDDGNNGDDGNNHYYDDENENYNGNNNGRRLAYANDDAYYANADFYNNGNGNQAQEQDDCENYYDVCENYRTACKDYSQFANDMEEFFECTEFNIGNSVGYLGPHCRSDGKTIGIGLYKDKYCSQYNADLTNVSSLTGMELSDDHLQAYYSDSCISCMASDGYELEEADEDEVTPICSALYEQSAKCNLYMGNDGDIDSYNQAENEKVVCNFIHNLITNSYDEYGEIYLDADTWPSYVPSVKAMTRFQKNAMALSVLLVTGLLLYSIYLHYVIRRAKFTWYPRGRKGLATEQVTGGSSMERIHSGIIQGRSRSGKDFEMNHEKGMFT